MEELANRPLLKQHLWVEIHFTKGPSMKTILGLIVPANPDIGIELVMFDPRDITYMQEVVGGYFTGVESAVHHATMWYDDAGRSKQNEINDRVSVILWLESNWRGGDLIVGDVLVTGQPDQNGTITSAPESLLDAVAGMYNWKFEVQNGSDVWVGNEGVFSDYFDAAGRAIELAQRRSSVTQVRVIRA